MFDEIINSKRIPSAQSIQARNDYLDKVLGKLPEIDEKKSARNQL